MKRWTEKDVRSAVEESINLRQAILKLKAADNQTSYKNIRGFIQKYQIPVSHFVPGPVRGPARLTNWITPERVGGSNFWYVIGLIATDGNLSPDNKTVDITSTNKEFLDKIKEVCKITTKILPKNKANSHAWALRTYHKEFYESLKTLGLMQRKSHILGTLTIPDNFFHDFFRGVVDGDGSLVSWLGPDSDANTQWKMKISSASIAFATWLRASMQRIFGVKGSIQSYCSEGKTIQYDLSYGRSESSRIAKKCYYPEATLFLERKFNKAMQLIDDEFASTREETPHG